MIENIVWCIALWISVVAAFTGPLLYGMGKIGAFFALIIFSCGMILFEVLLLAYPF